MLDLSLIPKKYLAKKEDRDERLKKCYSCPDLVGINCKHCLCFVHLKTWMKNETCPTGKW